MLRLTSLRSPARKRGFTLVELLVVIGIIAVLIAILLPALTAARKQAAAVKCLAHLRGIGQGFLLYANNTKGYFPVVRSDAYEDGYQFFGGAAIQNIYWQDQLAPLLTKGKMNFQLTGTAAQQAEQMKQMRASVLWGCPGFAGYVTATSMIDGLNRNNNGYSMNPYTTATATHPSNPAAMPPANERAFRWRGTYPGKWYKQTQWTKPSERMLVADATLWLFTLNPVAPGEQIAAQEVGMGASFPPARANKFDRYRHGTYPPVVGTNYSLKGGKVAYNVLYCDGHAATLTDIREGYRAVRMLSP